MSEKSKKEKKDLTVSQVDRQNILNNPYALQEIEKAAQIQGIPFEGKRVVTKEQVAAFFDVTPRTIDNHIERHGEELRQNGYEVLRGKRMKSLKLEILRQGADETDFVTKTTVLCKDSGVTYTIDKIGKRGHTQTSEKLGKSIRCVDCEMTF